MESSIESLIRAKNWLLNLLFPTTCLSCSKPGEIICDNCISNIRQSERETGKNILALYDYRDPIIKKAIWLLKYKNQRFIGKKLGELLYLGMIEDISDMKALSYGIPISVIPVPIFKRKKKSRGYNQAEIIARYFCKAGGLNNLELKNNIIIKRIETAPQAQITNRIKRLSNIKDAFKIKNPEIVQGRTVIVIDDVTTTGATLSEIIKILKKSGAKKIVGFAVAH